MANMSSAIIELARQVRQDTLRILQAVPEQSLTWAPPGTANSILWHAGHALWLQDLMCVELLSGQSELPAGWINCFAQGSNPLHVTQWPSRTIVLSLLSRQLQRMEQLLTEVSGDVLLGPPRKLSRTRSTLGWIVHGLHDEAKHSGEMYLLWKLWKTSTP